LAPSCSEIPGIEDTQRYLEEVEIQDVGDQLIVFFFIFLAVAWAAVVLPAVLRARQDDPLTASERFKRRMEMIAPPTRAWKGRWVVVPRYADPKSRSFRRRQARRLRIFQALVGLVVLTLAVSFLRAGSWWNVQIGADVALAFYAAFLVGSKRKRIESATKVRPLVARRSSLDEITFHEPARAYGGRR
jgi:hypothetical protein